MGRRSIAEKLGGGLLLTLIMVVLMPCVCFGKPNICGKTFGGKERDAAYSIQQTSDGGYIVVGHKIVGNTEFGEDNYDIWVLKLNSSGSYIWAKTFGGDEYDEAHSVKQTPDGGYIIAGDTASYGAKGLDFIVLKLDVSGNQLWSKTFKHEPGDCNENIPYSIQNTSDGGYIVTGDTQTGCESSFLGVLKLDKAGNQTWMKTFGEGYDGAREIQQTSDGGYVVAGFTHCDDFDCGSELFVLKLDSQGNHLWSKSFGGHNNDLANSVRQTLDGGYIVAGETYSFGEGDKDFWIMKFDAIGNQKWDRTFGGAYMDGAESILQTTDGGYIVAGYTMSYGAGDADSWILRLSDSGNQNLGEDLRRK